MTIADFSCYFIACGNDIFLKIPNGGLYYGRHGY